MSETKFTSGKWEVVVEELRSSKREFFTVVTDSFDVISSDLCIRNEHDAHLIAAAPEMYESLESTNKELEWAINEINRLYSANHNYHSLDEPERLDMQTCHDNAVLLAKARCEQ